MVRGCHEICSILPLLVRAPGGVVCLPVTILFVTILKNTYKTNTNKARMLFFSVKVTYHGKTLWNFSIWNKIFGHSYSFLIKVVYKCWKFPPIIPFMLGKGEVGFAQKSFEQSIKQIYPIPTSKFSLNLLPRIQNMFFWLIPQ